MVRKATIIGSVTLAAAILLVGLASFWHPFTWGTAISRNHWLAFTAADFLVSVGLTTSDDPRAIPRLEEVLPKTQLWMRSEEYRRNRCVSSKGFLESFRFQWRHPFTRSDRPRSAKNIPCLATSLTCSAWAPVVLFALLPAAAFVRRSVRDHRRWERGYCLKCRYDLTGNVSGVCSECGSPIRTLRRSPLLPVKVAAATLAMFVVLAHAASTQRWWLRMVSGESLPVIRFLENTGDAHVRCFSGDFLPVPADLSARLTRSFPNHHFTIAEMIVTTGFGRRANLIVVTRRSTGDVVSHLWEPVFGGPPPSLTTCFCEYQCASLEDALQRVSDLAALIVFAVGGDRPGKHVGLVSQYGDTIQAEIYITPQGFWYPRSDDPYRLLVVQTDEQLALRAIKLINPGPP